MFLRIKTEFTTLSLYKEAIVPRFFCKKVFLETLRNSQEHTCPKVSFNKVAALRPETLFKKRLQHRCFPLNVAKSLRILLFIEHLWSMLLYRRRVRKNLHYLEAATRGETSKNSFIDRTPLVNTTVYKKSQKKPALFRSSHQRCSIRKSVPRNFTKFTGKHLCQSLFLNKVAGLRHRTRVGDCYCIERLKEQ